jgi:hypothetical protein
MPKTLKELPNLDSERMLMALPKEMKSKTENEDPNLPAPYTETVDPILAKLRRLRADPSV